MKNQAINTLAGTSVVAILLGLSSACTLDATGSLDDEDMAAAMEDEFPNESDIEGAPVIGESLTADGASDLDEFVASAADEPALLANAGGDPPVFIENIIANGTGCPPGTYKVDSTADSFIVLLRELELQYQKGDRLFQRKNCAVSVKLRIPPGWRASVATVNTRGYAYLTKGMKATQTSQYYWAGRPKEKKYSTTLKGPYDDEYTFTDKVPLDQYWSRCGKSELFVVDSSIALDATRDRDGIGFFNNTKIDGIFKFTKRCRVIWEKC